MVDQQSVVDNIRGFVASSDQERTDDLVEWARQYASLCNEANERLRRCIDYLRRGLRSEAIHLAEEQPNLLDLVGALDFSELSDWENLCLMYGLARPPKLRVEAAAELNEAYADEQPIQALLARHRVLALGRAPLSERLAVMRQLGQHDPTNPVWAEDVPLFEAARLREVKSEASAAFKAKDSARLAAILRELDTEGWQTEVPEDLKTNVSTGIAQLEHAETVRSLRALLPAINDAYAAMSYEECKRLLKEWTLLVSSTDLGVPADLIEQVRPVLEWTDEKDRQAKSQREFANACAELGQAIDAGEPSTELERKYRILEQFGQTVPTELERRLAQILEARALMARRRARRNYAIAGAIVLVCATGTGYVIYRGAQAREAGRWAGEIQSFMKVGNLTKAEDAWKSLELESPGLAGRPDLRDMKSRLDAALRQDAERAARFRKQMDLAKAAGVETPNLVALADAEKAARLDNERLEWREFNLKVKARLAELQADRDNEFSNEVAALELQLKPLVRELLEKDPRGFSKRLGSAEATAMVMSQRQDIGPVSMVALKAVQQRMLALREDYSKLSEQRALVDREVTALHALASDAKTADHLASALARFVEQFPSSKYSSDFRRSQSLKAEWKAVDAWVDVMASWNGNLTPEGSTEATERIRTIDAYLSGHPKSPLTGHLRKYKLYLERGQKVVANTGPWKTSFAAILNSPLIKNISYLKTTDGRVYYLSGDGQLGETAASGSAAVSVPAIMTSDASRPRMVRFMPDQLIGKPTPSPQTLLSRSLLPRLESLSFANWETFGFDVADAVIAHPDVDPILRVILLDRVLKITNQVTPTDALERAIGALALLKADDLPWMNPDSTDAKAGRASATEVVERLPKMAELGAKVHRDNRLMLDLLSMQLIGRGILLRDQTGAWTVNAAQPLSDGHAAYCVAAGTSAVQTQSSANRSFRQIGLVQAGHVVLDSVAIGDAPAGSMVYICSPAASPR